MKYNPILHKLSNGVSVILDPMDIETTNVAVSFKTGSLDEGPDQYGITHFCEHMLCKGTSRFPSRKSIDDYMDENSGTVNAYTSLTELRLYGRILGDNLDKLIDVLSDQLRNSLFDASKIELERIVIQDELRRAKDDFGRQKTDFVSRTLFGGIPLYSFKTLGTIENIKSFSRDQMLNWLSNRLSAENCTIAISGKISSPDATLRLLESCFSFLPTHAVANQPEPAYTPTVAHNSYKKTNNVNIFIALPKRFRADDSERFETMCERRFKTYLRDELYEEIRQKHGLVYGISVRSLGQDNGLHFIETECAPEKVAQVVTLIARTCKRVYEAGGPSDEWLRRFESSAKLGDADWLDSAKKRQDTLVSHYHRNGKLYNFFDVVNMSASITAADVQKYSRGFFDVPISIVTDGPDFGVGLGAVWKQNFPDSNIASNASEKTQINQTRGDR